MSKPMKAVLDVLALHGDLEWARCVGGSEPLRPPLVAWRYKTPDEKVEMQIVEAVRCYASPISWIARKGERNWVIEPAAFQTYAMNFRIDVESIQRYGEEFPSDTKAALDDVSRLAEHLQRMLATKSGSSDRELSSAAIGCST